MIALNETGSAAVLAEAGLLETNRTRTSTLASKMPTTVRQRVEAMVETLPLLNRESETLAAVAHDARNMVTALGLYCDLLEEPGVLTPQFAHFGNELRLVAQASRRLVEKLLTLDSHLDARRATGSNSLLNAQLDAQVDSRPSIHQPAIGDRTDRAHRWEQVPAMPIDDLAAELTANRNLLSALAGASIHVTVKAEGCSDAVRLTGEDLTRILVNLVKNAAEAMPNGGHIQLTLREVAFEAAANAVKRLALTVEDDGPGIAHDAIDRIFESGFSSHTAAASDSARWSTTHRGLGLSITRSIVETAGGRIQATNGIQSGARFEIELPVRRR
jgi:signal transduction histidine kinase